MEHRSLAPLGGLAAFDLTGAFDWVAWFLPILLGVVAFLILVSVVDAHRTRNGDKL